MRFGAGDNWSVRVSWLIGLPLQFTVGDAKGRYEYKKGRKKRREPFDFPRS